MRIHPHALPAALARTLWSPAFVVAGMLATLLAPARACAQDWQDTNWSFRRAVAVANPGSTTLTNHQVRIDLDSAFDFAAPSSDGSDIRLTAGDGLTPVPFWIESWNPGAQQATLWVKVPSIPSTGTTVYIYYGNPAAASASNGSSTFEFFDDFEYWNSPPTGWADKAPLPTAIADHTIATFNGKLYSFGGYGNGPNDPIVSNYSYDPITNAWTPGAPMPTARWGMAAVEFDGLIYVFGGSVSGGAGNVRKNEVYEPATDSWTTRADIPTELGRQGVMGVRFGSKIQLFCESDHFEYDPMLDTYTRKADVPNPRIWCTSAVVGSKIYLIGGHHGGSAFNDNQEYDPATDSWAAKAPLPVALWGATRDNPVINGKIYVMFGLDGSTFHATNYVYDPATNLWEQKGSAVHARDGVGCGVINNRLYVVGGRADFAGPFGLTYNEVYDPTLDTGAPVSGPSQWTTSGPSFVFADPSARHQGNYGLVVQQATDAATQRFAQSAAGFGGVYALDFDWEVTDVGGVGSQPKPQGLVTLTETDPTGSLFFYNDGSVPVVRWFNGAGFSHLQNTTFNSWHKVTVVRNGADSRVVFDGTPYQSAAITSPPAGGAGKFTLGVYYATTQYVDDVRVRKWAGAEPATSVGAEQTQPLPAADVVEASVPPGTCISTAHICVPIPVTFTRSDATGMRAYSVKVTLGGGLSACGTQFTKGPYLSAAGATTFQVVDNQDGSYTIDEAILGSCGAGATGNGALFTLQLGSAAASGTGTIAISNVRVRDCVNQPLPGEPGADASIAINNTPPAAVTTLTASRQLTNNPVGQSTTGITIAYAGAAPPGGHVEVWRKRFGNYPEYDDGAAPGSAPTQPVSYPPVGWTATTVAASGQVDAPGSRDFWYYVAYTVDACGNAAASAMTAGALDYALGDVHDGSADCTGDNQVTTSDISFLGAHYGATLLEPDVLGCLDVGPTSTGWVDGRPLTDNQLEFEDLVMFAINFGTVSQPSLRARGTNGTNGTSALSLSVPARPAIGETFEAVLHFKGDGGVQCLSAQLGFDASVVEPLAVIGGSLLALQAGPAQVFSAKPGAVDAAVFGNGLALSGSGELARVRFRVKSAGDAGIVLGSVRARDARNQPVSLATPLSVEPKVLPTRVELAPSYPNPFTNSLTVAFGMPMAGPVKLAVFDIQGRAVRQLLDGTVEAGWTRTVWNGRGDDGIMLAPGTYMIRLSAAGHVATRSVRLVQ